MLVHERTQGVLGLVHAEAPARDNGRGVPVGEGAPAPPAEDARIVRRASGALGEEPREPREVRRLPNFAVRSSIIPSSDATP